MVPLVLGGYALTMALIELFRVWQQPQGSAFAPSGLRL